MVSSSCKLDRELKVNAITVPDVERRSCWVFRGLEGAIKAAVRESMVVDVPD